MEVRRYTAERSFHSFYGLVQMLFSGLWTGRELAWRLFLRDLKAQYRQSYLGYAWLILPTLVSTAVWLFLNSHGVLQIKETALPYPVYVLTGVVLWDTFVSSLNSPIRQLVQATSMLIKVKFSHEALLMAGLLRVFFDLSLRLLLLLPVYYWYQVPITDVIWFVPVLLLAIVLFGFAIGVLLSPVGVLYQDISSLLTMITGVWFFLTPVVYPPPQAWPENLVADANPIGILLVAARQALTGQPITHLDASFLVLSITLLFLAIGWTVYRLALPHLISRMGN